MSDDKKSNEKRQMSTTQVIQIAEDLKEALSSSDQSTRPDDIGPPAKRSHDILEAKIPAKAVVALVIWLVGQVLAMSGMYYDLLGEVRSLRESYEGLEDVVVQRDLDTIRMEIKSASTSLIELEKEVKQPPTSLDHMRVIGEIRTDLRVLEQRVEFIEKKLD